MDPDEVFTISFGIDSDNPAKPLNSPVNLSFVAKFKNGDTWHESGAYVTSYMPPKDNSGQNGYLLPAGVGVLILLAVGGLPVQAQEDVDQIGVRMVTDSAKTRRPE